ncbi:hypothetical protein C4D60_Mb02t07030 [Musa balbisiana]|uniref:Uncharacterized protein n=1 Tax=Musa balbisiana TaxID=52838 RepID=A0A4S8IA86_MUSBA|nr:hypothetical protein C4D60_Mb02t07030 [Musa balbisiana]
MTALSTRMQHLVPCPPAHVIPVASTKRKYYLSPSTRTPPSLKSKACGHGGAHSVHLCYRGSLPLAGGSHNLKSRVDRSSAMSANSMASISNQGVR